MKKPQKPIKNLLCAAALCAVLGGCATATTQQNARATRAVSHAAIGAGLGYAATYLSATNTLYGVVAGSSLGLINSWMHTEGYYDY